MDDYLPPINIKINVPPRRFLDRMAEIAETSGIFRVEKHYDALGRMSFDVVNLRYMAKSPHRNVGAQLIADPEDKGSVAVEIRAQRWGQTDPPTYDTYSTAARGLIAPLLHTYNLHFCTRHRMHIPAKERLEPKLPPQCTTLFQRFTVLANKSVLHPLDWKRFYKFVRDCRIRSRLSEDEMARLLMKEGFSEEYAQCISGIYAHLCNFKRLV
jgi:hypothetical protein